MTTVAVRSMLAGLVLLSLGCDTASGPAGSALRNAEVRWNRANLASYSFSATHSCYCPEESRGPVRITVSGGLVTRVRMISDNRDIDPALWFTVDELFALIRREMERLPSRLSVDYDATFGSPTRIAYGTPENDGGGVITTADIAATEIAIASR